MPSAIRLAALLFVLALAGLSGCMAVPSALEDVDLGAEAPTNGAPDRDSGTVGCAENTAGDCVVATPGCDPAAIRAMGGGELCATCFQGGAAVEICGALEQARCFDLESPGGGVCQRCVTDGGEVLYDDCAGFEHDDGLTCETVVRGDAGAGAPPADEVSGCASDADCGAGFVCLFTANATEGACAPVSAGVECEVCTDASGQVVRETCRPEADACEEVVLDDGRVCTECHLNGELAWRECTGGDIDPRTCEAYGDDAGRCVDCYGGEGELLSHSCSIGAADPGAGFCDVVATPGGLTCRTCYDVNGAVLSEACAPSSDAMRCEELAFTDQTCVVCVDGAGNPAFTECRRNDCAANAACEDPAACEVRYGADGNLCRVCPVEETGAVEQRCMSGGDLYCAYEDQFSEPPAPDDDRAPAPPPAAEVCVVCVDAARGDEVYRSCGEAGGAEQPAPAVCTASTTSDGAPCEICHDPGTGEEIFSSCGDG